MDKVEVYIFRLNPSSNYTKLGNQIFQDVRLSWEALGLLAYLLHLPPNFKIKLYNVSTLRISRHYSTRSALRELEKAGYVKIERTRDEKGRFGKTHWFVSEIPKFELK